MPQCEIRTNLRLSQIPADFNQKTTDLIATMQAKPANMVMVVVIPNQIVTFGGSTEPCALVNINSIGNISPDENRESCKKIFTHLETELNIPPTRIFINYNDLDANNLAWNNKTFEDILKDPNMSFN